MYTKAERKLRASQASAGHYEAHREEIAAHRAKHRKEKSEYNAKYIDLHRAELKKSKAKFYKENRENILKQKAEYYISRREDICKRVRKSGAKWRATHRKEIAKRSAKYNAEHLAEASWHCMHQRAENRDGDHPTYADVIVCARWSGINGKANFLKDMGPRPKGTSLSRFRDSGNYKPSNCAWHTRAEQAIEQRKKNNNV